MAARDAYSAALQRLYSANLFLRVKQGLRNTRSLMAGLDSPHLAVPVIHVAGTNGKGSVSWKLAKACEAAGLRTGLFTSPHISSARERVRINGVPISEEGVIAGLEAVERVIDAEGNPATFFERVTALAMRHFDEQNVDIAILEAGLGGRLDSTNVVEAPLAAVLTTVGMDHTSVLGDTAEQIAWEKSGIAKPGRPFVAGPCTPQALAMTYARARRSPFVAVPPAWWWLDDRAERSGAALARPGGGPGCGPLSGLAPAERLAWSEGWAPRCIARELLLAPGLPVDALPVPQSAAAALSQAALLGTRSTGPAGYDDDNSLTALWALRAVLATPLPAEHPRAWAGSRGEALARWHTRAARVVQALREAQLPTALLTPESLFPGSLQSPPSSDLAGIWRGASSPFSARPPCRMDAVLVPASAWQALRSATPPPSDSRPQRCLPGAALSLARSSATSLGGLDPAPEGAGIVLLDAAHNPEAMRAFATLLQTTLAPPEGQRASISSAYATRIVLACSNDRAPADMVGPLMPLLAEPGHLFVAEADATKAQSPWELGRAAERWWRSRAGAESAGSQGAVNVFERVRLGEEEAGEQARQVRADAAAASRRAAGLRAGARLSLDAEPDADWKAGEVDAATGLGRRYVRAALVAAGGLPQGAAGKGTAASVAQASAVQAAVRAAMSSAANDADVVSGRRSPLVVVCGSVYAMREAREAVGVAEPRDEIVK